MPETKKDKFTSAAKGIKESANKILTRIRTRLEEIATDLNKLEKEYGRPMDPATLACESAREKGYL